MEFFLCNKRRMTVKPTACQNSTVLKALLEKPWITVHKYQSWIPETIVFLADIGYLIKLLSNHKANLSPKNVENISNFEAWGLTLVAYKKSVVSYRFNFYVVHAFFISNTFISNGRLKLAKNLANAKQNSEVEFLQLFAFFIHATIQK